MTVTRRLVLAAATSLWLAALWFFAAAPLEARLRGAAAPKLRFNVSFPVSAHAEPITGRVYVMITRSLEVMVRGERQKTEPRQQVGRTGVPFFGRDVTQLKPGQAAMIDETHLGSPVESLKDIPPGEYFVQAMVNVYSEFRRADGKVVWMHDDQWEGQQWRASPGNLYSVPRKVRIDPKAGGLIALTADQVIPPVPVPADTEYVKRFRFQSPSLTKFWGRPIYLGATMLLPRDYDRESIGYPVNYIQGHFSLAPPYGFNGQNDFSKQWLSDGFPRFIAVTFQHPNPYFDDSYAVNSVNVGPYGDAIMQELIPEVEKRVRTIREPWARVLSGGSTGGWEAAALQIFHPDFFGGAWIYCPDSVTFTDVEGINIYEDKNAFYKEFEWRRVPTINSRLVNGQVVNTSEQRNRFELVNGTKGRSGEQLDIWSAVYGPLGEDGYFKPLFDKRTGVIDPSVAQYWKENYDLRYHLEKNWSTLGPKLIDKLFFYTGTADTYFLNNSTRELQEWMRTTKDPHYEGFFMYGEGKPHCWSGPVSSAERLKEIGQHIMRHAPDGTTFPWWKF